MGSTASSDPWDVDPIVQALCDSDELWAEITENPVLPKRDFLKKSIWDRGKWDKSAKNSFEIRGKKLGLVGYGNIGAQLSVLAESLGMEVYYYDVVEKLAQGNVKR